MEYACTKCMWSGEAEAEPEDYRYYAVCPVCGERVEYAQMGTLSHDYDFSWNKK